MRVPIGVPWHTRMESSAEYERGERVWFDGDWSRRSMKLATIGGDLEPESHPFSPRLCT